MPRRSTRLEPYYDSDGEPLNSYKENLNKIFKTYRRCHSGRSTHSTESDISQHSYRHSDDYSHNIDCDIHSCIRNSDSHNITRSPSMLKLWMLAFLSIIPLLCFGFVFLTPTLSSYHQNLGLSESPIPPTNTKHGTGQDAGYCDDTANRLRELQDMVLRLEQRVNYLLPVADTLPNFALESQGACVISHLSSATYQESGAYLTIFGFRLWPLSSHPRTVVQGNSQLVPGRCWPFTGGRGHLFITLSHPVTISHVTLGHMSKKLSPTGTIPSAPKEFSVYGMTTLEDEGTHIGTFLYDQDGDHIQTFKVADHKKGVFKHVKLQVESNWGHPDYTCLYDFRVHGKLAD